MAERDPKVLAMVEREIKKDPKVSNAELQKRARRINKEEAELSPRSFHARYPLPVKKRLSGKAGGRKKGAAKKRSIAQRTPGLRAAIDSLVEAEIKKARGAFDAALDSALKKARKSGKLGEFERVHQALIDAGKTIGKV